MVTIKILKHSDSGKSCFCKVFRKVGPLSSEVGVGYLYKDKEEDELPDINEEFPYQGDVSFEVMVDAETGEVRTSKSGAQLQRIVLK